MTGIIAASTMIDIEDEISFVLHEFRQQSCSQSTTLGATASSVGIISTKNSSSNSTIKNNKSHRGYFSDVRYYRMTRSIVVSYLFDKVLLFDFEISLLLLDVDDDDDKSKSISNRYRKYYTVTYKADAHQYECYSSSSTKNCSISNNSTISNSMKEKISILKQRVQIICDDLNHRLEEEEGKTNQTKNKCKNRNNDSSNNNNQLRSSTTPSSSSLFAVMSKLLLSLNNLQTELIFFQPNNNNNNNNNNEKDSTLVVRPMTDRERSSHISYLSAKKKRTTATKTAITEIKKRNKNIDSFQTDSTVDLALLLLRCACVGKHRDVFLNPIPPITTKKDFVGTSIFDGGVADKIWIATEYRRRYRLKKQQQKQQQQQNSSASTTTKTSTRSSLSSSSSSSSSMVLLHSIEQELFGFLYSLPWIKRGKITAAIIKPNTTSSPATAAAAKAAKANPEMMMMMMMMDLDKNRIRVKNTKCTTVHSEGNRIVIEVCLDLDSNNTYMTTRTIEDRNNRKQQDENEDDDEDDGNDDDDDESRNDSCYSPRFARLCKQYGVVTAYHGTHMDHVWSIINNGFFNMSDHPLFCKNGAMMGSGVYLSTSKKVATFFATNNSSKNTNKIRTALKHDSLRNILQMEGSLCYFDDDDGNNDEENRSRYRDVDEFYDISCYPVFENRIIRPPNNNNGEDKTGVTGSKNNSNDRSTTRRDGKYYVVPDGRDIRITRLHLTFELKRKRSNFLQNLFSSFLLPNKRRSKITFYTFFAVIISVFIRYVMPGV